MEIHIRKVEKSDIKAAADIKIKGWKTAYKGIIDDEFLNNMDKQTEIEKCEKYYKTIGFIVAESDGKVVGFCRYTNIDSEVNKKNYIDCEIRALYVEPKLKGNGIGKELFKYVINDFIKNNKKKMIIWCLKDNHPSRAFYEKMGGKIFKYKKELLGEKEYELVSYVYDLDNIKI